MDITKELISTIKDGFTAIERTIARNAKGTITFERTHSIVTIHKAHIAFVLVTNTTVTVNTSDGRNAFYAAIQDGDCTDYLAAVETLRNHDYNIPSFANLTPTRK